MPAELQGGFSTTSILRIILGFIELWMVAIVMILGTAFVMGLLGANPDASFATWIYSRTNEIMKPFSGIFDPISLTGDFVVQTSLLFAMAVYGVLAALLAGVAQRLGSF